MSKERPKKKESPESSDDFVVRVPAFKESVVVPHDVVAEGAWPYAAVVEAIVAEMELRVGKGYFDTLAEALHANALKFPGGKSTVVAKIELSVLRWWED